MLRWNVEVEPIRSDVEEKELIHDFLRAGCRCSLWKQKCFSLQFSVHLVEAGPFPVRKPLPQRVVCSPIGQHMANSNNSDTNITESGHKESVRQKAYTKYSHTGIDGLCHIVCLGVSTVSVASV